LRGSHIRSRSGEISTPTWWVWFRRAWARFFQSNAGRLPFGSAFVRLHLAGFEVFLVECRPPLLPAFVGLLARRTLFPGRKAGWQDRHPLQ